MGIPYAKLFIQQTTPSESAYTKSASSRSTLTLPTPSPEPTTHCTICASRLDHLRADGRTETLFALPCSHTFGSHCILRWLEHDSPYQDCPACRRKMVYIECGHLIRPCAAERAPKAVSQEKMPRKCLGCRGLEGKLKEEVEELLRRAEAEQRALVAMKVCFPGVWGELCRDTVRTVGRRVEESREGVRRDIEELCRRFEEEGGREQW
ncbi:hypothetical protein CJF30_00006750 [Rutstroemia sp. NJR-2017a BBW]|nr:hypothetical protein CJF30_00006750 [Rutstroemia sp. NJR-2017a BBW]